MGKSFSRAMTYSLGSICLGSFIIAVIKTLKALARAAEQQARGENRNAVVEVLFCCLMCIINCIESWAQFITEYAYCHVAIFGKPFMQAAKDTWNMIFGNACVHGSGAWLLFA